MLPLGHRNIYGNQSICRLHGPAEGGGEGGGSVGAEGGGGLGGGFGGTGASALERGSGARSPSWKS